ncbi:MAG: tRNA 2-selenouridine(34) synthase MnmH [Flavobacteriales bacterium]|nr:tRNA 2-selenouridine(34) synthase MnmH [Flavobacteriales bacterium]
MPQRIDINDFFELRKEIPVIDARTPKEFEQGHIPGAYNIPVMDNEDRVVIGTLYKQNGKQPAIMKGLELAGPKLKDFIKAAKKIPNHNNAFIVHCWRGGMRSGFLSWILEFYGFKIYTLIGGYKAFRRSMLQELEKDKNFIVLGGKTGSGKTLVLHEISRLGEQVLDLEKIAHHKGSSFGSLGEEKQPSQEQFENNIAFTLKFLESAKRIWIEDESRTIGNKVIPAHLWEQLRSSTVVSLEIPQEERLNYLIRGYSNYPLDQLIDATARIEKRLGPEQTKNALIALRNGDFKEGFKYSLQYYDKTYAHGLSKREKEKIKTIHFPTVDPQQMAAEIIKLKL